MTIDRIYVSEATLSTIERYGQNNMTNVSGKPDDHLCVEFVRAAPTPTVAADAAAPSDHVTCNDPCQAQPDERAAFEAWFATSGIWNEAVARRTWSAACDWMRTNAPTESQIEQAVLEFAKKPGMLGYVEPGDLIDFARFVLSTRAAIGRYIVEVAKQ